MAKEVKHIKVKQGPYSCEELANLIHAGETPDFKRFVAFLILVTAFVSELEERIETEPIQTWAEDEKRKLRSLLYEKNHQDCFTWFKPGALLLAQRCEEAIAELKASKPDKKAVESAIATLQEIRDVILPKDHQTTKGTR